MIKATSAGSSLFACDTKYYLPSCTPAVYDPFLRRDKSSVRHTALNKLTVFVVYNICSEKWLCCQRKCCQGQEEFLKMSKLSLLLLHQRSHWDKSWWSSPLPEDPGCQEAQLLRLPNCRPLSHGWARGCLGFTWHIHHVPPFCKPQGCNRRKQISWDSISLSSSGCCLWGVPYKRLWSFTPSLKSPLAVMLTKTSLQHSQCESSVSWDKCSQVAVTPPGKLSFQQPQDVLLSAWS